LASAESSWETTKTSWVAEHGAEVHVLNDPGLIEIMGEFIDANHELWFEDIGKD
jgi:cytosine deaminase